MVQCTPSVESRALAPASTRAFADPGRSRSWLLCPAHKRTTATMPIAAFLIPLEASQVSLIITHFPSDRRVSIK